MDIKSKCRQLFNKIIPTAASAISPNSVVPKLALGRYKSHKLKGKSCSVSPFSIEPLIAALPAWFWQHTFHSKDYQRSLEFLEGKFAVLICIVSNLSPFSITMPALIRIKISIFCKEASLSFPLIWLEDIFNFALNYEAYKYCVLDSNKENTKKILAVKYQLRWIVKYRFNFSFSLNYFPWKNWLHHRLLFSLFLSIMQQIFFISK